MKFLDDKQTAILKIIHQSTYLMDEIQNAAPSVPEENKGCINCGHPVVVKGFPNALCESCRNSFIKHPIPKGIKIFAAAIAIIFLFSMYKIPKDILLGIHLDKGNTALEEKRYITAQNELQIVVDKLPENLEAESNLLIASFYNEDFKTYSNIFKGIADRNYEDLDLYKRVETVLTEVNNYFPTDSFAIVLKHYNNDATAIPDTVLKNYIKLYQNEPYPILILANRLIDKKNYGAADTVTARILVTNPWHIPALGMMAVVKREENKLEESISYCDKILAINKESTFAMSCKVRTYLKEKRDADAMALALKCNKMDEHNYHAVGSLILAYHFTNKIKERDTLINKMDQLKDSNITMSLQYVKDIISGKESFRN
jgi:tetratricopeptide (TPR) repeat protein